MRSIVAGALYEPRPDASGVRRPAPDEDAFTLTVAALERLRILSSADSLPLERVEVVGPLSEEADWAVPEAIGADSIEVRHHPSGAEGLFHALTAASTGGDPARPTAVVAVDVPTGETGGRPSVGCAAVALKLATGAGAAVLGHTVRSHPVERRPVAAEWVRAARRATPGEPSPGSSLLALIADEPPPVLLATWARTVPGSVTVRLPWSPPGRGYLPSSAGVFALHAALGAPEPHETVWLAAVRPDRTDFLALRAGPVSWTGDWSNPATAGDLRSGRHLEEPVASAVSEGAYVPRARYLENLPSRWRFSSDRCGSCGELTFPARGACRTCGTAEGLTRVELPMEDLKVEAVTTIAPGAQPTEFDFLVEAAGGYSVVLVELAPGIRATLQVVGPGPAGLRVGDRADTQLRRLYPTEGAWRYGRKAVPRESPSTG